MSAEVVGTAFVRIRAITKQLSKEIQDGVDKGIKDAKVDQSGELAGEEFATGFGDASSEGINASIEDTFDNDDHERAAREGGDRGGKSWAGGFKDSLDASVGESVTEVFIRSRRDREQAVRVGGERDGETYTDGFRDGVDRDRNLFTSIFRGVGRSLSGVFDGLGSIFGGGDGGGLGLLGFGSDDGDAERRGHNRGLKLGKGVLSGVTKALAGAASITAGLLFNPVTIIGGLVAGLTQLLVPSIIGIVSQIGTLFQGLLGGVLGLGAGLGAGLLSIIPLIAAFTAETPLLELFKEEMAEIGEEFKVTAEIVQEQVLPGVLLLAETFVDSLLPAIDDFSAAVGDAFGDFTEALSDLISSQSSIDRITRILEFSADGFRGFLEALIPFTDFILRVFEGLSPLARVFADDLNEMFTRWSEFAEGRGADGLNDTFQGLYDTFVLVGGGLTDLTVALYNILAIGDSATGQGFFERFREWAREFREFTTSDSGISHIQGIFERAQPVLSEFAGLLGDIMSLVIGGTTSETASNVTVQFLQFLREDAIPWLVNVGFPSLGAAAGAVFSAVGTVVEALTPFFSSLYDSFRPVIEEIFGYFETRAPEVLEVLTQALSDMEEPLARIGDAFARGLGSMFSVLAAFADTGVFEVLVNAFVLLVEVIAALVSIPGMAEFIGLLAGMFLVLKSIAAVVAVVGGLKAILAPVVGIFVALASAVAGALGAPFIVGAAVVLGLVAAAIALIANWSTVVDFFTNTVPEAFGKFFDTITDLDKLGEIFSGIGEAILEGLGTAFSAVGEFIVNFVKGIPGFLSGLGSGLLRGFASAVMSLLQALPGLVGLILDVFLTFVFDIPFALVRLGFYLVEGFIKAVWAVVTWLTTTGIPSLVQFFLDLPRNLLELALDIGPALVDGFTAAFNFLTTSLPGLIAGVVQFFLNLPGELLSIITEKIGPVLIETFKGVMDEVKSKVGERIDGILTFFGDFPGKVLEKLGDLIEFLVQAGIDLVTGLKNGIDEAAEAVFQWFRDMPGKILDAIKDLPGQLLDAGKEAMKSFAQGITDGLPGATGSFDKMVRDMAEQVPGSPVKKGPLRVLNDGRAGKAIIEMLAEGIRDAAGLLNSAFAVSLSSNLSIAAPGTQSQLFEVIASGARRGVATPTPVVLPPSGGSSSTTSGSRGRAVVFEPGSVVVHAQNASASEVADEVARRLDWALTTRDDR